MAITYGFFNSIDGDRRYDAVQMSSIFDGIIRDGVYMHVGTAMMVRASVGMSVTVGLGRAWFDHTWTLNDALYPLTIEQSEVVQDRIDTVVLEVDNTTAVRANSFKVIKGIPSLSPVAPALTKSTLVNQYPLCNIRVNRGVTVINQANITNRVGTSACPFVTGPLELMDIDALIAQWADQWHLFYDAQTEMMTTQTDAFIAAWQKFYDDHTTQMRLFYETQTEYMSRMIEEWVNGWQEFYDNQTADIQGQNDAWRAQWESWYNIETTNATNEMVAWRNDRQQQFDDWFASLQAILEPDVAANMSAAILDLQKRTTTLEEFKDTFSEEFKVLHGIEDSSGDRILDSNGQEIEGQIIFCIKPCGTH